MLAGGSAFAASRYLLSSTSQIDPHLLSTLRGTSGGSGRAGGALVGRYPNPGINKNRVQARIATSCGTGQLAGKAITAVASNGAASCHEGSINYHSANVGSVPLGFGPSRFTTLVSFSAPIGGSAYVIHAKTDLSFEAASDGDFAYVECDLNASNPGQGNGTGYTFKDVADWEPTAATANGTAATTVPLEVTIPAADDPYDYPPNVNVMCTNLNWSSISVFTHASWTQLDATTTSDSVSR